jgi:hypothetical protein
MGVAHSNRNIIVFLAVVGAICIVGASRAQAQDTDGAGSDGGDTSTAAATDTGSENEIDSSVKGMVGLGLIGAELGFVLPAVAGLHETWAFIVFPIVGAAGGAVGGYLIFDSGGGSPELSVAMLTAGMALIIPATVITLSATSYDPEDEPTVTTTARVSNGPRRPRARSVSEMARRAGNGLVRWSEEGLFLAAPAVVPVVHPTPEEARQPGSMRATGLRVSMLSGRF